MDNEILGKTGSGTSQIIKELIGNADVTEEQYQVVDMEIKNIITPRLWYTNLFPVDGPLGVGVQEKKHTRMVERSPAIISWALGNQIGGIDLVPELSQLPIIYAWFKLDWLNLAASKRNGTPLDVSNAREAAKEVAERLEDMCLIGWEMPTGSYEVNGLLQGANNDYSTSKAFSTAGNPSDAIRGGLDLMEADKIYAQNVNIVLNSNEASALELSRFSGDTPEMPAVERMIGTGSIYRSTVMTIGKGIIMPIPELAKTNFELVVAEDITTRFFQDKNDVWGLVTFIGRPIFYDQASGKSNAVCLMSDIQAV